MFILFPSGGLGNQLFMVASIYSFARSTGQPWFVNTGKHTLVQGNTINSYLDNIFWQIPLQDKSRLLINRSKTFDLSYHAEIIYDFPDRYSYFAFNPYLEKSCWSLLDSHMFNANYFNHYREELSALFSLTGKEEEKLQSLYTTYINPLPLKKPFFTLKEDKVQLTSEIKDALGLNDALIYQEELKSIDYSALVSQQQNSRLELIKEQGLLPTVSLHVRRGDYLRFSDIYRLMTPEYYQKALEALYASQKEHLAEGAKLLVFSDDLPWCKANLPIESWIKEVVYLPLEVKDYQALLLMAQCDFHIIGNSSFSWWGSFLDPYQGKTVAPFSWFKDNEHTNEFINLNSMLFIDNRDFT